ncbi:PhoU-like phosphate uptake regulator [Salana multivorans]|uniref:Phosphate-specific transport system accessory protein PhoU n=1 Tax=Salana multivorans TaxID=120377 RepID=A0A3N2D924_9MICO|nr:phosphate signaling complex protein PhoU [Salana multivorans]OJX97571.1 MAG: phosphate transport system regulatory protein PhoU [Micrococcales bacterium 73-15]ROR96128.1 PhoU-like phosphate uptake regulator [Salana multivorans]
MREIFQQDLEQVGDDLVAMARLVREALEGATSALLSPDLELAERVIDGDRAIDRLQEDLEQQCITLLARQQPVATDLRVVVTGLRLSATIERMGDLARHVAEVARGRFPEQAIPEVARPTFEELTSSARAVATDVVDLLEGHDVSLAARVLEDDDRLDALHRDTFRLVLAPSAADHSLTPQEIVDITLLGRYLERFGDHGVAVARRILFLVTGDAVAHTAPAR